MHWLRKLLPSNSLPIEQEAEVQGDIRNSLIAGDSDVIEEFEYAEMQPQKRQRIMDEKSIVIYDQDQGSSSNSQLMCQLDMLPSNSALSSKIECLVEKLDRLFARRCDVLVEREVAELQPGKKRREEVHHWLNEVQRIKIKLLRMRNDGQGSSSNSNISGSIESYIEEVDELMQRSKFPNGLVLLDQGSTGLPDIKPVGTNFQKNTEKILGWLRNHEHCIIGVYGMGGVGKTTLLKHIHGQLQEDSNLSQEIGRVYWVTVSQNCPVHKLQKDIAKALDFMDIEEDDERKTAAVLHDRLATCGRIVLILDDMWEQVSETKVGIPLENGNCKIILSTRSYDVCRKMGCKEFVIKVETLNIGEAWDLFVKKLGHYDTLEQEAKKIAWDIAEECGGLPLAIATMARSMTGIVSIDDWSTALNELKSARHQVDMKEDVFKILQYRLDRRVDVFKILQYSYNRLDRRVQNCFLSCILYEEDAKIQRTTLIDLWIHEGLLDDTKSRDAQVSKGHIILNRLEGSDLLESVSNNSMGKCVKMQKLIRDMAIIITKQHPLFMAEAGKQLKQLPEEEKWSKDLVNVSLMYNKIKEIPSGMAPVTPNLTVLMLNGNPCKHIPDSFFVHMRALTVLDLSATSIQRVPESVSNLENLRALLLSNCRCLIYVPSVAKLTKLRTLDLDQCYELKEAPRGLERLKCVERLSYIPWDVANVIGFNEVIQSLTSLSCYRFWICDFTLFEISDEWDLFYERLMWISGGEFGEDKSSCLLPTTLECLIVNECDMKGRCLGDVFQSLGEATSVEYIRLVDCRGLESISGSSGTQQGSSVLCAPQLEVLELESLPDLRNVAKLGMTHSFSHLRDLYITGCPKMKVMFQITCTNQLHLPNLESIEVRECEVVEEIYETNKAIPSKPLLVLPKLESLKLVYLPKIEVIFPLAKQLQLEECEQLEEISGSNKAIPSIPILSFPNLKRLDLVNLPKIKVIFPFTDELHLPNLQSITVACCEEVEEIFESNKATLSNPILSLPNLKEFILVDLPELGSIYRGILLSTSLVNPTDFIRRCPKLKLWTLPGGLTSDEPRSYKSKPKEICPLIDQIHSINQATCLPHSDDKTSLGASLSLFPISDRNPLDIDGGIVEDALLYCALFPPDLEFEKDTLVQLWIAVGFFVEEPKERFAGLFFEDYLTKGYLQFTRTNLVTGKAMYKFKGDSHILQDLISRNDLIVSMDGSSDINVISPEVSHLSIRCHNVKDPDVLCGLKRFKHLRTLILFHGHKMSLKHLSYDFFVMLRQLQVLDLSKTHLMELPSSIGIMKCLSFLDLSDTLITRLPEAIDCLEKLQTLKLRGCSNLFTLPKGMRRLVNLRHLEFDVFRQLRSMPEGMGDLTNIQTLSAFLVGVEEGCSIRQIKKMNNLSGSFCISRLENVLTKDEAEEACLSNKTQLKKMELHWSDSQDEDGDSEDEDVVRCGEVLSSLRPNASLEELNISCFGGSELPRWICDPAFSKLVSITLFECENCSDLPSLGQLPALKYLNIVNFHKLMVIDHNFFGDLGIQGYIAFPKLEKLTVENMLSLEEWSGIRSFEFPSLLNFTVKYCPKLRNLCTLSSLCSLKYLEISHCAMLACPDGKLPSRVETFIIEDCPSISSSLSNEDLDWQKVAHIPHKWIDHQEILLGGRYSQAYRDM